MMFLIDRIDSYITSIDFTTLAFTSILTGAIWIFSEVDLSYIYDAYFYDITNPAKLLIGPPHDYIEEWADSSSCSLYVHPDHSSPPSSSASEVNNDRGFRYNEILPPANPNEEIREGIKTSYDYRNIIGAHRSLQVLGSGTFKTFYVVGVGRLAAAISSTGGAYIGFLVAKYVVGSPWVKGLAGFTTAIATQALYYSTYSLMKFYGSVDLDNSGLNILYEINNILSICCIFMCVIVIIYITRNAFYNKPPCFFYKSNWFIIFFSNLLNNYLNLWVKVSDRLIGLCYCVILFSLFYCGVSLGFIINYVNIDTLFLDEYEYINKFKFILFVYYMLIYCIIILCILFFMYFTIYRKDNSVLKYVNDYKLIKLIFKHSKNKGNRILIILYTKLFISIILCKVFFMLLLI